MSTFQERMEKLRDKMSPEATTMIRLVLAAEHKRRFSENRRELPESYAAEALKAAKTRESEQ